MMIYLQPLSPKFDLSGFLACKKKQNCKKERAMAGHLQPIVSTEEGIHRLQISDRPCLRGGREEELALA